MAAWGTAGHRGTFGAAWTPSTVAFAAKPGRYLRFVALSEVTDKAYAAVAELHVSGEAL